MHYEPAWRPAQVTPPFDAFDVHKGPVGDGLDAAYLHEGVGGQPIVLIHGYPETKRIWWRNVQPLAEAGFEVIVPDLRGYGDSDLSPDDAHDLVLYSKDIHALVHDHLGQELAAIVQDARALGLKADRVILSGQPTGLPQLLRTLAAFFDAECSVVDAPSASAVGAALIAADYLQPGLNPKLPAQQISTDKVVPSSVFLAERERVLSGAREKAG